MLHSTFTNEFRLRHATKSSRRKQNETTIARKMQERNVAILLSLVLIICVCYYKLSSLTATECVCKQCDEVRIKQHTAISNVTPQAAGRIASSSDTNTSTEVVAEETVRLLRQDATALNGASTDKTQSV
jgi:hypothetical protein